jgi:hypothetical protein
MRLLASRRHLPYPDRTVGGTKLYSFVRHLRITLTSCSARVRVCPSVLHYNISYLQPMQISTSPTARYATYVLLCAREDRYLHQLLDFNRSYRNNSQTSTQSFHAHSSSLVLRNQSQCCIVIVHMFLSYLRTYKINLISTSKSSP